MDPLKAHQEVHCLEPHLRESFRILLDGFYDGPSLGAMLGASLEESGFGANAWGLFEACLKLANQKL